ncbi:MAG: helix-turn-helix transcriptional regulator [Candidatus Gastranaerophilales bacterium]
MDNVKDKLKRLGKNIKIERVRNDLSQERLAELLDVSPRTVCLIENGLQHPKIFLVVKIANVLNVEIAQLLV